jgi:dihydroxyacetone kinase
VPAAAVVALGVRCRQSTRARGAHLIRAVLDDQVALARVEEDAERDDGVGRAFVAEAAATAAAGAAAAAKAAAGATAKATAAAAVTAGGAPAAKATSHRRAHGTDDGRCF